MYYFILPYALQQGEAAFINQYIMVAGKSILSPYATVFIDVCFFITLGITIVLVRASFKKIRWFGATIISFFLGYVFFVWVLSFMNYPDAQEVFLTGRQFMYISLSYFLWIAIFQSVTREQYEQFLKLVFYVTPISAMIYVLNSSRIIQVYDPSLIYLEVDFGTETFLRDFRTIPLWLVPILVLAILSMLTPTIKIPKNVVILNIVVLPVALLFTFTRSLLFIVVIQVAFLFLLNSLKLSGKLIGNVILFAAFLGVSFLVIQKVFPSQSAYFEDRLLSAKTEGKSEQNVNVRLEYVSEASRIVNENSTFVGAGMNRKYYLRMGAIGAWIADSTIPYFLVHTGWIGVLWIFLIVLVFFVDSLILYWKTRDWLVGYLCAYFLAVFISSLIMGSETLTGSAWTLTNFALYTVLKYNKWKVVPVIEDNMQE